MYIPIWKKWLSYLTEVHLESSSSEYNESLHVSLCNGRLQLSTDNAIYSYADKYENFYTVFEQITLPSSIQDVLILGFGLGSIPYMLEKKFSKTYKYTGVELDEEVIFLASKYVLPNLRSDIVLVQADAINYMRQCSQAFDVICIDIFVDDKIPSIFLQLEFLQLIKSNLAAEGKVIFNHLANNDESVKVAIEYFKTVFQQVFPDGNYLQILGNGMLVNN